MAVRPKKDSSLIVGMRLVKEGKARPRLLRRATRARLWPRRFSGWAASAGVERPALGSIYPAAPVPVPAHRHRAPMPTASQSTCVQFALMGDVYARVMFGLDKPKIGIISNGEEADKGSMLVRETYPAAPGQRPQLCGQCRGQGHRQGAGERRSHRWDDGQRDRQADRGHRIVPGQAAQTTSLRAVYATRSALVLMIPGAVLHAAGPGTDVARRDRLAAADGLARNRRRAPAGGQRGRR